MKLLFLLLLTIGSQVHAGTWCEAAIMDDKAVRDMLKSEGSLTKPKCVCSKEYSPAKLMRGLKGVQNATAGQMGKYTIENEKDGYLEMVYTIPTKQVGVTTLRSFYAKSKNDCKKGIQKYVDEFQKNSLKKYE